MSTILFAWVSGLLTTNVRVAPPFIGDSIGDALIISNLKTEMVTLLDSIIESELDCSRSQYLVSCSSKPSKSIEHDTKFPSKVALLICIKAPTLESNAQFKLNDGEET